ncbi:hypothetical protein Tco_0590059 [Tanacetum coccineum]
MTTGQREDNIERGSKDVERERVEEHVWCQTTPTEFWCHGISGAKLHFADVAPLLEFGTKTQGRPSWWESSKPGIKMSGSHYSRYPENRHVLTVGFKISITGGQGEGNQKTEQNSFLPGYHIGVFYMWR